MTGIVSVLIQSLILSIMAIGVYISYKILDFPDMTADGSFSLGGAVIAISLASGMSPILGTILAFTCGLVAGLVTSVLHIRFKITNLLSGILVMGMLYSINLGIMGKSNMPLFTYQNLFNSKLSPLILAITFAIACKVILDLFLKTGLGYTLKGVGDNPQMIKSLGVNIDRIKTLGLMISNGLIALSGGLFGQFQGFSDVNMGIGTLVLGIASIIIGMSLFKKIVAIKATTAIIIGTFIYQFTIYLAINFGLVSADNLKLITSVVIVLFLTIGNTGAFANKHRKSKKIEKRGVVDVAN
ncbi:ABC transporter permease [Metaclostridioides mangenotii]|uniref:ABC transport system permease protein n=1 Tax=Metaclostridioides mangenotii TaxID=1540 RepID=A0ABS4EB93_9FIRM|nr:ABC transporter permease [Clostridioides mangenotii]MBP1855204.1 putative ABC transport system permease protein [Clostridioides mangenotii]